MAKTRGRQRDAELAQRRCEQLLDAAADVFARRGYPEADIQEVADVCGVAKGTVYTYFPSKEQLFLAAVDRAMQALCNAVREACHEVKDPLDRIEVGIRTYLTYFRDHPGHAELLILERAEFRDRKAHTYMQYRAANRQEWFELYEGLIAAGRMRNMPIQRILNVVGDLVYGTMFTNHFSGQHRSIDEQVRDVVDVLFCGLLTPRERRRRMLGPTVKRKVGRPPKVRPTSA